MDRLAASPASPGSRYIIQFGSDDDMDSRIEVAGNVKLGPEGLRYDSNDLTVFVPWHRVHSLVWSRPDHPSSPRFKPVQDPHLGYDPEAIFEGERVSLEAQEPLDQEPNE